MFAHNDIVLAHETYCAAQKSGDDWLFLISDDDFLEKYDRLTKKMKKTFQNRLEQARQEVIPADAPDDLPVYHAQLDEIFADFL